MPSNSARNLNAKMGTAAPLAIGTRGTIGSLVRKEIEYFNRLGLDRVSYTSKMHHEPRDAKAFHTKPAFHAKNATSSNSSNNNNNNSNTRTSSSGHNPLGYFLRMSWRRKKKKSSNNNGGNGSFLPRMCSAVDVNEGNHRFDGIPGFNYRSLKDDVENL